MTEKIENKLLHILIIEQQIYKNFNLKVRWENAITSMAI